MNRYGVQTAPGFWLRVLDAAVAIEDCDGDVKQFFDEKIKGFTEMRDAIANYGSSYYVY